MSRLSRAEWLVIAAQTAFGAALTVIACTVGTRLAERHANLLHGLDGLPDDGGDLPSVLGRLIA